MSNIVLSSIFINPYIFHNRFKVSINSLFSNFSFFINRVDVIIS